MSCGSSSATSMTAIEDRDARICRQYVEEKVSAELLAMREGLGLSMIRKILQKGGATGQPGARKRSKDEGPKVLGPMHTVLGARLSHYRTFYLNSDRSDLAADLGWSLQKLAYVEKGSFNLTLTDMQDLCKLLQVDLIQFLATFIQNNGTAADSLKSLLGAPPSFEGNDASVDDFSGRRPQKPVQPTLPAEGKS